MAKTLISMRFEESLLNEIDSRGEERTATLHRDLERYYESLRDARARLRNQLSVREISALMDNLNGVWIVHGPDVRLIWANVEDGCRLNGLDRKWKIDGASLVNKLRSFSLVELCAIADAAERFWNRVSASEDVEPKHALND